MLDQNQVNIGILVLVLYHHNKIQRNLMGIHLIQILMTAMVSMIGGLAYSNGGK